MAESLQGLPLANSSPHANVELEACGTPADLGKERGDAGRCCKSASLAREGRARPNGAAQVDGRKGSQVDGESSLGDSASLGDKKGAAQVPGRKGSQVEEGASLVQDGAPEAIVHGARGISQSSL
jgi:hypothetical protein